MSIEIMPALPLESFREHMSFHPFWFWGMADSTEALRPGTESPGKGCRGIVKEYAWHDRDEAGREDIRRAIARAEQRLSEHLRFYPAPVYIEETLDWPKITDRRLIRGGTYDADDRWMSVKLRTGWVQALGVEARTLIQAGVSVNYIDEDHDGYVDLAVMGPITSSLTDVKEIAAYFTTTDRIGMDKTTTERWRIAPLKVTISGGQITLSGPAWMFVSPILLRGVNPSDINPKDSPLVTSVDVYRRYTDGSSLDVNSSQGVVYWETRPWHGWGCCCSTCAGDPFSGSSEDVAGVSRALARVGIRNAKRGRVIPAESVYNVSTGTFSSMIWTQCEEPDRVTIRYLAGYPLDSDGQMDSTYRELVAILAAAELGRPISGCAEANRLLFYWQQDLSQTGRGSDDLYATSADILDNPFGSRRGHVYAWRKVLHLARGEGIRVG